MRTWVDEQPDVAIGGSLRLEVEDRASAAIVPRAEYVKRFGPVVVRPGVALPFFFAPFTMIGVEASVVTRLDLAGGFGLYMMLMGDAYFAGSDVPRNSTIVMFNGLLGVDLEF